ncbi:MAG TPA: redoxin domain-containing protein [Candidatus Dormibacteraeota bacterium]|nr:redoxin domain-containing protein [Candidatus Dormibacteraeota bacterium]
MTVALVVGLILAWATVAFIGWLLYLTVRQQGRVLIAHEEIRTRLANAEAAVQRLADRPVPVPVPAIAPQPAAAAPPPTLVLGTPAPDFRLPDLKGRFRTLADYHGMPSVLVFFNPDCGFCTQLAPKLGELSESAPQLVVMSRGDKQVNKQLARTHHWKGDVLLEPNWDVASSYRTNATPTGYLIDAEGRIASTLAVGVDGVMTLTRMLNGGGNGKTHEPAADLTAEGLSQKQDAAVEKAKAAGLSITDSKLQRDGLPAGTEAPNFTLPDLAGRKRTLADFRGKRTLLVFSDPDCGPCQTLAPSLAQLHEAHQGNNLVVLMVSKGDLEANRQKAREHGFNFPVVLQRNWEVSKDYAMFATPVGYLIDERGVIARDVAVGGDAILRLVSAG